MSRYELWYAWICVTAHDHSDVPQVRVAPTRTEATQHGIPQSAKSVHFVTNCGNTSCSCTFVNLPTPSKMVEIYDNYVTRLPVTIIVKFMWCEMWEFDNIVHTWCINVSTRPLSLWSLVQAQLEARDDEEDDEYSWTRWEVLRRMAWSWAWIWISTDKLWYLQKTNICFIWMIWIWRSRF